MSHQIRIILTIVVLTCLSFAGVHAAFAQTTDAEQTVETPVEQTQIVDEGVADDSPAAYTSDGVDLSKIDWDDPAIAAAIEAHVKEQADTEETKKAIGTAVLDQVEKQKASDSANLPAEEGSSFFNPENLKAMALGWWETLKGWLTSTSFLAMVAAIVICYVLAPIIAKQLRQRLFFFREKPADGVKLKIVRDYVYRARSFLRATVFVALLALAAFVLKSAGEPLGQDWLVKIVQGIAIVFLLYKAIREFIPNALFRKLATWIAIPLALITVMGGLPGLITWLETTPVIPMGETPITAMTLIRLGIFGALFFWLGNIGNVRGQDAIRSQEGLDIATREIVAKLFQMLLFVIIVILVMSFAGIPLSGLVMIMSAIGLGIGLGLQPIAANFVSGIIILFDRSVRQGDFVVLPDGQEGYVEAINMRSTTVETTDGKDIMVPNTTFIENTYENWTHKDPAQRYEVYFKVPYDTDIEVLEDMLIPAIAAYDKVLMEPEEPDLELREFGEYGIHFAIEFWVSGIDDGENKFTSDLNYIVWRTLRDNGIKMPIPRREVKNL